AGNRYQRTIPKDRHRVVSAWPFGKTGPTGKALALGGHMGSPDHIHPLPGNRRVLTSGPAEKVIRLWQLDDRSAEPLELQGNTKTHLEALVPSPDGLWLAAISPDSGQAMRWALMHESKQLTPELIPTEKVGANVLAYSPDRRWLIVGCAN